MSTKKIQGFAFIGGRETATIFSPVNGPGAIPATLVIGGNAFTEEEVQQIVIDLYSAAMDGPYMPNAERMREVAAKHGITL